MKQKKKNLIWAVVCPVVYITVLWNLTPFVYGIADDRTMMEIVSGQYLGEPDAHMIFIGYWYSLLVAGLYTLLPTVEWYALCFLMLQSFCISLTLCRLMGRSNEYAGKISIFLWMLIWCMALGIQITSQITFTTTAAVLAVTAIFWYMTAEQIHFPQLLVLFLLCFLAAQIRISVFCMILPVCAMLWFFRFLEKGRRRECRIVLLLAIGVFGAYFLGERLGYGDAKWRSYLHDYNDRAMSYDYRDYEFPRYEDRQDFYNRLGIASKDRVKNLYYYNITADDRISPDFFVQYLEARKSIAEEPLLSFERLKGSIKDYMNQSVRGKYGFFHLFALAGYGALILWQGGRKRWRPCFQTASILGVQTLLWLYLIYRGRMPERVLICMNLMLVVPLLVMWMEWLSVQEHPTRWKKAGAVLLAAVLSIAATRQLIIVRQKNAEMWRKNQDVEELKRYCAERPEYFYFNDVTSMAFSTWNVRLCYDKRYRMNYMSLGDWISYSPLWAQKLKQQGIGSVKDALYAWDHVYLASNFDRGVSYLTGLYDDVACTEVDRIQGFGIYKLESCKKTGKVIEYH